MKTQIKANARKQRRQIHFLLLAACLGLLSGCEYVRHVKMSPGLGGVLAVNPPHDPDIRQRAKDAMAHVCQGKRPRIIKEGAVVVGQVNNSYTNVYASKNRRSRSVSGYATTTSSSYNVTQWRIAYICQRRRYSRRYRRRRARWRSASRRYRRNSRYSRRHRYHRDIRDDRRDDRDTRRSR